MVTRKNSLQLTFTYAGIHAAVVGNPQVSRSNTKSPMLTMDRATLNEIGRRFLSRARSAILGKSRPEE